ncbi:MAG: DHHA1 domain-containing protein [Candidatus Saccharibacteria bacterium]|nr:DHHA1 domain-containing protein [Candidatus Saccharibacteria bacterium]
MISSDNVTRIRSIIEAANHVLVIQADNPDADSLGSALALEELLEEQGKRVTLYCGVNIPGYLGYVEGYDRVTGEVPRSFDAGVIVDASTTTLLQKLQEGGELSWVAAKPCIVLDHHESVQNVIDFAEVSVVHPEAASTGVIITELARKLGWKVTPVAAVALMVSVLGDTQGLTNNLASADTYRDMAELIEAGADRPALEEKRRAQSKMTRDILAYKATLIQKVVFSAENRVASVVVPQDEIVTYSPQYNPAPLIQGDLLQTEDVRVAIVFKVYDNGRVTGSIRCNNTAPIANTLAEAFGGGGHPFAAGFKREDVSDPQKLVDEVRAKATKLLGNES